jgi:hypothetical protein
LVCPERIHILKKASTAITLKKPTNSKSIKFMYQDTIEGKKETASTEPVTYRCVCAAYNL